MKTTDPHAEAVELLREMLPHFDWYVRSFGGAKHRNERTRIIHAAERVLKEIDEAKLTNAAK